MPRSQLKRKIRGKKEGLKRKIDKEKERERERERILVGKECIVGSCSH
jgi:hypothetical protein